MLFCLPLPKLSKKINQFKAGRGNCCLLCAVEHIEFYCTHHVLLYIYYVLLHIQLVLLRTYHIGLHISLELKKDLKGLNCSALW